jgi:hypothetical protein
MEQRQVELHWEASDVLQRFYRAMDCACGIKKHCLTRNLSERDGK